MILFYLIIEIFALSYFYSATMLLIKQLDACFVGASLVNIDQARFLVAANDF